MDLLRQFAKGEPVFLAGVVAALLTALGLNVTDEMASELVAAVVPIVLALLARRHATPAANPAVPRLVVENGKVGAVPAPEPVVTFSGRRV